MQSLGQVVGSLFSGLRTTVLYVDKMGIPSKSGSHKRIELSIFSKYFFFLGGGGELIENQSFHLKIAMKHRR